MWARDISGKYFFNLESTANGYQLICTDLREAYIERLSQLGIESRGDSLGCEFALSTEPQVSAFINLLSRLLIKGRGIEIELPEIRVAVFDSGVEVRWTFRLDYLPEHTAKSMISNLVLNLLGTVDRLGSEIRKCEETIESKNEVIAGMDDALARHVDYFPPRHLNAAYKNRELVRLESQSGLDLVAMFWPENALPVIEVEEEEVTYDEDENDNRRLEDSRLEDSRIEDSRLEDSRRDDSRTDDDADSEVTRASTMDTDAYD